MKDTVRAPFLGRLQVRLFLLILLAVVPALAFLLQAAAARRTEAKRHTQVEMLRLARVAAGEQEQVVERARQVLDILAEVPAVRDSHPAVASRLCADLLARSPAYKNIGLVTPEGWVVASGLPMASSVNVADRAFFRRAMATREFAIGDYQIGRLTRQATVNFARPVFGPDGRIQGVLFVAVGLDWLGQVAAHAELPPGAVLQLVDANGTILARSPDGERWVGRKAPAEDPPKAVPDRGRATFEAVGVDGVRRLYAYTSVGGTHDGRLLLGVGFSTAGLFASGDRAFASDLLVLGLAVVLALLLAWLGGDLLVLRRVRALVQAAENLRAGDLTARTGLPHGDCELGRLAHSVDHLAESLERQEAERARAEEEARRQRGFSTQLIESSVDGITAFDGELRITLWNPGMERITGLPREDVVGRSALDLFPSIAEAGEERHVREALAGQASVAKGQPFTIPTTGRSGFFEAYYSPLRDEAGRIVGALAIVHDITARRGLEEQLRQAQKMEAVGRLAGGVAHDFNNLLTAIMGYAQLMTLRLKPDDPALRDTEEILRAAERASMLTRQLLAFSRREVLQPKLLDLNAIIADMGKMLRRLIGEAIDLLVVSGEGLWPVKADAGHIEQVIMNLAVNARDAMPEGGRLTIETANVELGESYAGEHVGVAPGSYVLVSVSDSGTGMDAETKARVFEPFFTTKGPDQGTGLGLSTVYGIVQQWDGAIQIYSDPGWGTTVKIYLPRAQGPAEPVARPGKSGEMPRGSETVLFAEDQDPVAAVVRATLQLCGYRVLEAHNGSEAVTLCERYDGPIHLLVTDVVMPGTGGPELAASVRKLRPEVKVLFVSGYSERAFSSKGVPDLDAAFLQKPFMPEALARKVREVLDAERVPSA